MRLYKIIFLSFLQVFILEIANAQEEQCSQNLEEAQLRYDEGRIQDIEGLVLRCLDNGSYDKAQSEQAMRLLILSYIFRGEDGKADTTMLRLLQRSHEFVPDEALDPVEFINLHNTYRTKPIFRVGLKAGPNMTMVEATKLFTTGQPTDPKEYIPKQGITAGVVFEYEFAPRFTIYPELYYSSKTILNNEDFQYLTEINTHETNFVDTKEEWEKQVWFEFPVSVQYRFTDSKFRPYVNAGGSVSYLNSSSYPGSQDKLIRQSITIQNALGEITAERNKLNFYAFLGAGLKYKIGEGYIVAEARANYGLTEISTGEYSFKRNPVDSNKTVDQQIPQRTVANAYKQHFAAFTLGYTMNFYKPKKL